MRKWLAVGIGVVAVVAAFIFGISLGRGGGTLASPWARVIPTPDVRAMGRPSFATDVQPIFNEFCLECHGAQDAHNGLRLDSYEGVMKGTNFGSVVVPGQSDTSNIIAVLKRETSPSIWMPYHRERLSPNRIKNIESWIKNGALNN